MCRPALPRARSRSTFLNGLERATSVWPESLVAGNGAWTTPNELTLKLSLYETPYYTTLQLRFDGNRRLVVDSEHNVGFGSTKLPQLVGEATP